MKRISFRDGLVLDLEDYNELVISAPLALTLPATETDPQEVVAINPAAVRTQEVLTTLDGAPTIRASGMAPRRLRGVEADEELRCAGKQHHRERELGDDEELAKALVAAAAGGGAGDA